MHTLKRAALPLPVVFAVFAALMLAPVSSNAEDDAISAARTSTEVAIVVSENYEATSRWTGTTRQQDLPFIRQPYADLARRLFELAGVTATNDAGNVLTLQIDAGGTTEATLYDSSIQGQRIRETNYRAARIGGSIRLETTAGTIERRFDGVIPAPYEFMVTFGYDLYRDPNNAPFREAFEAPGGYAATIAALIRDLYGEAVLLTALTDRDPLVRRAAELGLGQP